MNKRITKNYINNPDFLMAMINYQKACKEAEDSGERRPVVTNYLGECFYHIANRLGRRGNFSGYSYLEDMKMDGIESCLKYMHNFSSEKTSNPFAYFTQIIWNAFLQRIAKEKKQLYSKFASSQELIATGGTYTGGEDLSVHLNVSADYINTFMENYEEAMKSKRKKVETVDEEIDSVLILDGLVGDISIDG